MNAVSTRGLGPFPHVTHPSRDTASPSCRGPLGVPLCLWQRMWGHLGSGSSSPSTRLGPRPQWRGQVPPIRCVEPGVHLGTWGPQVPPTGVELWPWPLGSMRTRSLAAAGDSLSRKKPDGKICLETPDGNILLKLTLEASEVTCCRGTWPVCGRPAAPGELWPTPAPGLALGPLSPQLLSSGSPPAPRRWELSTGRVLPPTAAPRAAPASEPGEGSGVFQSSGPCCLTLE